MPFIDLWNFQLSPLKVSYDLIETDYGDNSIRHNHVGYKSSLSWRDLNKWRAGACF